MTRLIIKTRKRQRSPKFDKLRRSDAEVLLGIAAIPNPQKRLLRMRLYLAAKQGAAWATEFLSHLPGHRPVPDADWKIYEAVQEIRRQRGYRGCTKAYQDIEDQHRRDLPPLTASGFKKAYERHRELHGCSDKTHP